MARPLTLGEPITVRLPLSVDAFIRARAAARGEHPGVYIRRQLVRLAAAAGPEPVTPPTLGGEQVCAHALARPIAGGLKRCPTCQATRGLDGVWRS